MVLGVKNLLANAGDIREASSIPGSGRSPGGGYWQSTPVVLSAEFHGQRSLAGYSPWGLTESDTTEATELVCMFCCMDIQEFVDPITK